MFFKLLTTKLSTCQECYYLRYCLTGAQTCSRITPVGSSTCRALMADTYWVKMSDVFAPGCNNLCSNLKEKKKQCHKVILLNTNGNYSSLIPVSTELRRALPWSTRYQCPPNSSMCCQKTLAPYALLEREKNSQTVVCYQQFQVSWCWPW